MDGIKEMLDRLSDLDEGQLSDLESKIIGEFETVEKQEPTAQVVDSMTALADALDAVRGEQHNRVAAQKDLEQRAAEAASRVKPKQDEESPDDQAPTEEAPVEDPTELPPTPDAEVPPAPEGEAPSEELPAEEETEEEKKKKAVPAGTFAEAEIEDSSPAPAEPPPPSSVPTPDNEPTTPDNEPATPSNEPGTPSNEPTTPENEPSAPSNEAPAEVVQAAPSVEVSAEPAAVSTNPPAPTEEIPVAASASDVVVTPPAENRPVPREHASVAITAGADIPGISAGTELTSSSQVTNAFMKRLQNLSRVSSPNGQQYTVATLTASFPEDRVLNPGDTEGNWDKIQKVAGVEAIVAAAGACIPLEIRYDIDGIGSTDTPVQDSLPRFTADRGGIRFYPSPLLPEANYDGAIGVWDPLGDPATNVTDLDGNNPRGEKPCLPVQCLPFEEAVLEAVSVCLCFDNLTGRVFPELIRAHNELSLVQHARSTEQFFLSKLKAGATHTVRQTAQTLGAARELLAQVDKVTSVLRYRNRISPTQSFRVVMPYWVHDIIRADISFQMPGDGLQEVMALADSKLNQWFSARNINITWSMEAAWGVDAPTWDADGDTTLTTTSGFPDTIEWDVFAEGTWLVLDGGTLDLGVIRDSSHVANNTYCEFTESFYNLAHVGGESVHVISDLKPTGAAADLKAVS